MSDRPKVGPADPETRRKKLREALDTERSERATERDSEASAAREKQRAARKAKKPGSTLGDLLNPDKPRQRRAGTDGATLEEAVKEGVRQGTEKKRK